MTDSKKVNKVSLLSEKSDKSISHLWTYLTRTSIFFPLTGKNQGIKPIHIKHPWGELEITGYMLSVFDESVFLALVKIGKFYNWEDFLTTTNHISKVIFGKVNSGSYKRISESLERLALTSFKIQAGETVTYGILKHKADDDYNSIEIIFDPTFKKLLQRRFKIGNITQLDISFRRSLQDGKGSGNIAKALYRFLKGQSDFYKRGKYQVDLYKLMASLNCIKLNYEGDKIIGFESYLGYELPKKKVRALIKKALDLLVEKGFLRKYVLGNGKDVKKDQRNKKDLVTVYAGESQIYTPEEPVDISDKRK